MQKPKLDDEDFPVSVDGTQVITRDKEPVATAESEDIAAEVADRLNEDAWRRHEDNWSA